MIVWQWSISPTVENEGQRTECVLDVGAVPVELLGYPGTVFQESDFGPARIGRSGRRLQQDVLVAQGIVETNLCGGRSHRQMDGMLHVEGEIGLEVLGGYGLPDPSDDLRPHADLGVVRQVENVGERGVDRIGARS